LSDPILVELGGVTFATGVARFRDSAGRGVKPADARIYLQVLLGELSFPVDAMVDTATPWCIFDPSIDEKVLAGFEIIEEPVFLQTRLGRYQGTLYQGSLKILADEGDSLDVEATLFLSPDWPGGNFIGYLGLLQKIRFAVDPHRNRFYFSSL
jgi:hypothetical protein